MNTVRALLFAIATSALCLGCGGGGPNDLPELGTVTGKVKLNGVPQKDLRVQFYPEGGGASAVGVTDATGKYSLTYGAGNLGAKIGPNIVSINWNDNVQSTPLTMDDGTIVQPKVQPIPLKYHEKTELKADVKSGDQVFDFELKSI